MAAARTAPTPRRAPAREHPAPVRRRPQPVRRPAPPRSATRLDVLLRGRAWVALIGALLAGIVFLNVTLLKLNEGITQTSRQAAEVGRENAQLRVEVARRGSSERIKQAAEQRGLTMPAPVQVTYLRTRREIDARLAARAIAEP